MDEVEITIIELLWGDWNVVTPCDMPKKERAFYRVRKEDQE